MKKYIIFILSIIFSIIISLICYAEKTSYDLTNNIFRLHIIANDDSEYEQRIKLKVKDSILQYLSNKSLDFNNVNEVIEFFNNDLENIHQVVNNCLKENNYDLQFNITINKSYFPTKHYDNISLPPGKYNCLKICLGNSKGENWWCVLYPNLCSTDLSIANNSKEQLKNSLQKESYEIISNNISYRFKIVELVKSIL